MANFKEGDDISWSSQSGGFRSKKEGKVVAVVDRFTPLPKVEEKHVRRYDVTRSQNKRYFVRVERKGKRGQELKPAYYAPTVKVVDRYMAKQS